MYKRYSSMAGDITMVAPRRLLAQTMAGYGQDVYSYRWDAPAKNESSGIGVQHFADVGIPNLVDKLMINGRYRSYSRIPCSRLRRWGRIQRG